MARGSSAGYDRFISIFSPEGRLYQIEYTFKAVKTPQQTSVAILGADSVTVVTQKKVPDTLLRADTVTHMFQITPTITACMTGLTPDARRLVYMARQEAAEYEYDRGVECPVAYVARRLADKAQIWTQQAGTRPLAVTTLLIGTTAEDGTVAPQLWRVDPAGFYAQYRACAAGAREIEATNFLEKKVKNSQTAVENPTSLAIHTLQHVLNIVLKPTDVEVATVSVGSEKRKVRLLSDEEIDTVLTAIAERD